MIFLKGQLLRQGILNSFLEGNEIFSKFCHCTVIWQQIMPEYKPRKLTYKACLPANKHHNRTKEKKGSQGKRLNILWSHFHFPPLGLKDLQGHFFLLFLLTISDFLPLMLANFRKIMEISPRQHRTFQFCFSSCDTFYVVMCSSLDLLKDQSQLYQDV